MSKTRIKINQETLTQLSRLWRFKIHGDFVVSEPTPLAGLTAWDLEFPNMTMAMSFATTILDDVVTVDIRKGDCVKSLYSSVVLTLVGPES